MGGWLFLLLFVGSFCGSNAFTVPVNPHRHMALRATDNKKGTVPERVWSHIQKKDQDHIIPKRVSSRIKKTRDQGPSEPHLLPLLEKLRACETPGVVSPHKLPDSLHPGWINDLMRSWRSHTNSLEVAQNTQEILDTVILNAIVEPDRFSYGLVMGSWVYHATTTKNLDSMERAAAVLHRMRMRWRQDQSRPRPELFLYEQLFLGWLGCAEKAPQAYQHIVKLLRTMRDESLRLGDKYQKRFFFHVCDSNPVDHLDVLEEIVREWERPDEPRFSTTMRRVLVDMYLKTASLDTSAAEKAPKLLQEWYEMDSDPRARPSKIWLARNMVSDSKVFYARNRALVDALWRVYEEMEDITIKPDKAMYNVLIKTLSNTQDMSQEAQDTLQEMWDRYHAGDEQLKPDIYNYGGVFKALLAELERDDASTAGESLLRQLWQLYNQNPEENKNLKPNSFVYACLVKMWFRSKEPTANTEAARLLREMQDMSAQGHNDIQPKAIQYYQVICAIARCAGVKAKAEAEQVFQDLCERYEQTGDIHVKPNHLIYTAMMQVLATNTEIKGAGRKVVNVLREMWEQYESGDEEMKPDGNNYSYVLKVLSADNRWDVGYQAEEILREMWHLYEKDPSVHPVTKRTFKPTGLDYGNVIQAWGNSGYKGAGDKAEGLLRDMWSRYEATGDGELKPNKSHYTKTISTIPVGHYDDPNEYGERAMALLEEMWKRYDETGDKVFLPNKRAYGAMMEVFAVKPIANAGNKALGLLRDMEARYKSGITTLRSSLVGYSEVMKVLYSNPTDRTGAQAEELLRELWDTYNEDKVANASMKPNVITYGCVIRALCNSKDEEAVAKGRRVLQEMWDRYNNGDVSLKPTKIHYTQIIACIGGEYGFIEAQELLAEMWNIYHATGDDDIKPDSWTHASLRNTLYRICDNKVVAQETLKDLWKKYKHNGKKDEETELNKLEDESSLLSDEMARTLEEPLEFTRRSMHAEA